MQTTNKPSANDVVIQTIINQRNSAMDQVAMLAGQNHELQSRVEDLSEKVMELQDAIATKTEANAEVANKTA